MLASSFIHLPNWLSLAITVAILAAAVVPSLIVRGRKRSHTTNRSSHQSA